MPSITYRIPGFILTEHTFQAPLDYSRPSGPQIEIFARAVVAPAKENADLPWLVFLQGGPGFPAPRPTILYGWLERALQDYRVLLLDMRGTGRSTPVLVQTLERLSPAEQVAYLRHFRADGIIQDAELIRKELLGAEQRWTVLGQSYGGFCVVHYLSAAPEGLAAALITGGLPPLDRPIDDVYHATVRRQLEHNRRYFQRYPEDQALADRIAAHLAEHRVLLPNGDRLTVQRFQQLGINFGMEDGYEKVHYLMEQAFVSGADPPELSYTFLREMENAHAWDTNPIYAILHEPIYCQGEAANWSAQRVLGGYPQFNFQSGGALLFSGEMVFPWMFEEIGALRPLRVAADLLAQDASWPRLYNLDVLAHNSVPAAAAVYYDDPYVERAFSTETQERVPNLRLWITNEHAHSALRLRGEAVLDHLIKMVRGEI